MNLFNYLEYVDDNQICNIDFSISRVLEQTDAFSQAEARNIVTKLANHNINIGVKKLLGLLDMCKYMVIIKNSQLI